MIQEFPCVSLKITNHSPRSQANQTLAFVHFVIGLVFLFHAMLVIFFTYISCTINSKKNKASPTLVRSIFLLTSKSGKIVNDACLLQYHISSGEDTVNIEVQPHRNRKECRSRAFHPTGKSTLDKNP